MREFSQLLVVLAFYYSFSVQLRFDAKPRVRCCITDKFNNCIVTDHRLPTLILHIKGKHTMLDLIPFALPGGKWHTLIGRPLSLGSTVAIKPKQQWPGSLIDKIPITRSCLATMFHV